MGLSRFSLYLPALLAVLIILPACKPGRTTETTVRSRVHDPLLLAKQLEESLIKHIIEPWYPRIIDTLHGGYISDYNNDWTLSESPQNKALVQQARHIWSTSFIYQTYPDREEFLDYSAHGFEFLRKHLWDKEYGGFHAYCNRDGSGEMESLKDKRIYGQAFAVYGLSQYHRVSHNPEALELAKRAFLWMEEGAHDPEYGGYFEFLLRDGTPVLSNSGQVNQLGDSPATGLKDYNSSIHLMEALTELYRIWSDSLVHTRLEEMFYLVRDTFVHHDGYLQLYFYPDWTLVPGETMEELSEGNSWFTQHFSYGHDVETAYLLLETAHILGLENDDRTMTTAKGLVDHALESGWDEAAGGFYNAGKETEGGIRIINRRKSWWSQIEGLNALILMHTLFPDDEQDYLGKALLMWEYMNRYLIDNKRGGWYNYGLDISPESETGKKSHAWKTTYHNVRGMVNCIVMLRNKSIH